MPAPRIPVKFYLGSQNPQPLVVICNDENEDTRDLSDVLALRCEWRANDGGPGVVRGTFGIGMKDAPTGSVLVDFSASSPAPGLAEFPTYGDYQVWAARGQGTVDELLFEGPFEQSRLIHDPNTGGDPAFAVVAAGRPNPVFVVAPGFGGSGGGSFPTFFQVAEPGGAFDGNTWVRADPSFNSHYPDRYGNGLFVRKDGGWYPMGVVRLSDESGDPIGMMTVGPDGNIVIERFTDDSDHHLMSSLFMSDYVWLLSAREGDSTREQSMQFDDRGLAIGQTTWDNLVPVWTWRGAWQPHTLYNPGEAFGLFGEGAWYVLGARGTYDGNAAGISPPYDHPAVNFIGGPIEENAPPIILRAANIPKLPTDAPTNQTATIVPSIDGFFLVFDDGVVDSWTVGPIALSDDEATVQAAFDAQFGALVVTVTGIATDFLIEIGGPLAGLNLNIAWGVIGDGAIIPGAGAVASQIAAPPGSLLLTSPGPFAPGSAWVKVDTGDGDWFPVPQPGASPPREVSTHSSSDLDGRVSQGEGTLTYTSFSYGVITDSDGALKTFVGTAEFSFTDVTAGEDGQQIVIDIGGIIAVLDGQSPGYYDWQTQGAPVGLINGTIAGDAFVGMMFPLGLNTVYVTDMVGAPVTTPLAANDGLNFTLVGLVAID